MHCRRIFIGVGWESKLGSFFKTIYLIHKLAALEQSCYLLFCLDTKKLMSWALRY